MKLYAQLSLREMEAVARLAPTREEVVTTFYSDEGVHEVRGKLFKVGTTDADAYEVAAGGRVFRADPSVSSSKEVWQIPYPHTLERKTVATHHLEGGLALIVEKRERGATYFFTGGTEIQAAEFLEKLHG